MRSLAALGVGLFVLLGYAACSSTSTNTSGGGGTAGDASVGGGGTGGTSGAGGTAATGGAAGASGSVTVDQIASEVARVLCDNLTACYGAGVKIVTQGADCQAKYKDWLEDAFVAAIKNSLSTGIDYDPKAAAACIAELESASSDAGLKCLDLGKAVESCKSALSGLKSAGGPCAHSFECAKDHYCDASGSCPGKCTPFLSQGKPCTSKTPCAEGLTCFVPIDLEAGLPDPGTEQPGTCEPYVAKGASCGFGTKPACEPGTLCVGGTCKVATGLFTLEEGYDCGGLNGTLCKDGLACELPALLIAAGKCVVVKSKTACHLALPDMCGDQLYCPANLLNIGTPNCTALPAEGEACAESAAQAYGLAPKCRSDLLCAQGKCQKPKRIGADCSFHDECVSGYCKPTDPDAATAGDAGVPGLCAPISC